MFVLIAAISALNAKKRADIIGNYLILAYAVINFTYVLTHG